MMSTTKEYYYDTDYVMDRSKFLNLAVALSGFDNEHENILDPSIAELKFYADSWDVDDAGNLVGLENIQLESHFCSKEELGLTGKNSRFLP